MKNISNFGWMMIFFSVMMISIAVSDIYKSDGYKNQLGKNYCDDYAHAQRSNVPIGCYEYFGIK